MGTARYPSPQIMKEAIDASKAEVVTVSIRRQSPESHGGDSFWRILQSISGIQLLPNTAGCRTAKEAITTAHMARELFNTTWIKLEVIGDEQNLIPDPFGLIEATAVLVKDGFQVLPYTTHDLVLAERLIHLGCRVLMPWGSYIGSGQGLRYHDELITLRARFPETVLIVDAGLGSPSHASQAMEIGMDGVLLNTAVAICGNPVLMAQAFSDAVLAGRKGFKAHPMLRRETAKPSTPVIGMPFWHT